MARPEAGPPAVELGSLGALACALGVESWISEALTPVPGVGS